MTTPSSASAVLLQSPIAGLRTAELGAGSEPALQRFFEANPEYFVIVTGEPAEPGDAHEEIHGALPEGWPFTKKWVIGHLDDEGEVQAVANVASDLLAPGIWHIGLFIVATARHGNGDAQVLYRSLEAWARQNGARWMRLGVVEGNARGGRFWERMGFVEVRRREAVAMGKLTHTLLVMAKPLAGGSFDDYLALVPRDRPEA
jgi:GNAT superfamily N-acetyltransferase